MRIPLRLFILFILLFGLINIAFAKLPDSMLINVPFISQAPLARWSDARQQDGCEEAAVLMAIKWVKGEKMTKKEAETAIIKMAQWEEKYYKNFHDTNSNDTAERLIRKYWGYKNYKVYNSASIESIIKELSAGRIVIVPTNGRKLKNPNYKQPGPERHNLLIKGYDYKSKEFITNDPGTRRGDGYRYKEKVLIEAIIDYPTGNHLPIKEKKKAMITVWK